MRLNWGWNAEPNAPDERVAADGIDIVLEFNLNHLLYPTFADGQRGHIRFRAASQWRLGATNDEGWYRGQCRFSGLAPAWGEFYEVTGDLRLESSTSGWVRVTDSAPSRSRHFLFYLRDSTFECQAESFEFRADRCGETLPNKPMQPTGAPSGAGG